MAGPRRTPPRRPSDDNAGSDLADGLAQTRAYWDERGRADLPDLAKLQWAHRRTQRMRFEAFLLEHDLEGRSVLDVGCGLGDFYAHLRWRGVDADYTGFDLAPSMIALCRARYPGVAFLGGDFLQYAPPGRFDYTVSFGIHNVHMPGLQAIMEATTRHQYALASVAAHVSLLSDRAGEPSPPFQAWRAEEILTMALAITPHATLRHDYLQNDLAITLYRAPLSVRRPEMLLQDGDLE